MKSRSNSTVLVMGRNTVREVFRAQPERIKRVLTTKDPDDNAFLQEMQKAGKPVRQMNERSLSSLLNSDSHQGFAAELKPREHPSLKEFLQQTREKSLVLVLDSIFDPQNFGAILRAAECFGVDAVIYSKNRGASVTPSVTKASVGASELIPMIVVSNLAEAVRKLQDGGYFAAVADVGSEAKSALEFDFPDHTALVLGSEGKGIQPLIAKYADASLYIPMQGKIDSLNVSQAAAVFCALYGGCVA
jgi:23S rRNA (guanosine2251-2'-O)-methyltransferase